MTKEEALSSLDSHDYLGRKILPIYDDEVPDFVVQGLINEHKRSLAPKSFTILGGIRLHQEFEKAFNDKKTNRRRT